jgi:hypothetical protein
MSGLLRTPLMFCMWAGKLPHMKDFISPWQDSNPQQCLASGLKSTSLSTWPLMPYPGM